MLPDSPTSVTTVAQIIQLAVAPVFLLAGIGAFLNVCASRLARIVDGRATSNRAFLPAGDRNTTASRPKCGFSTGAFVL